MLHYFITENEIILILIHCVLGESLFISDSRFHFNEISSFFFIVSMKQTVNIIKEYCLLDSNLSLSVSIPNDCV